MRNFHQNRRVVAYCADLLRSRDLSTEEAVRKILLVADILALVRGTDGHKAILRSRMLRHLGIKTRELEELIDPMLPFKQQRLERKHPVTYRILTRDYSDPGTRGHPGEYYTFIRLGRPPKQAPLPQTWDGDVVDAGYRESLQWDIATEMVKHKWMRESALIKRFQNLPTLDGQGKYGLHGVRAYIDEMVAWNRLRRATDDEARALLGGPRNTGRPPAVIMLGDASLNPEARKRARKWSLAERLRELKIQQQTGPLESTLAREEAERTGQPPRSDVPEPPDAAAAQVAESEDLPPEKPQTRRGGRKPSQDGVTPTLETPAQLGARPWAEDEWPEDEPVPGEGDDEGRSTLRSAAARDQPEFDEEEEESS